MTDDSGRAPDGPGSGVKSFLIWLVVIGLIVSALWLWLRGDKAVETPLALPPAVDQPEPLVRHPIPEPLTDDEAVGEEAASPLAGVLPATLPELDRSDQALHALVEFMIENPGLAELVVSRNLIRRFVITIDSLGGRVVPQTHLPVTTPEGRFLVEKRGERNVIHPRNYERYGRHVALLDQLDSAALAEAYIHFYPLFQQAYRELGYPQGFFNDRLIAVIDEILATPATGDPVALEQPLVFYTYADPEIEALTAGQRLLIRTGPDNAVAVKRKLREIRQRLVR
jgi:hypothetical protein